MKSGKLVIIWLVLVALFASYGFIAGGTIVYGDSFYWGNARDVAVQMGSIGIAVATMTSVGLHAIISVRKYDLEKKRAVGLLAIASVISAILPPLIMACSGLFGSGDSVLTIPFTAFLTICVAVVGFVSLTLCVLLVSKKTSS
jgi:TRAP-type C4-dicarboxylate transport system permease large subunit